MPAAVPENPTQRPSVSESVFEEQFGGSKPLRRVFQLTDHNPSYGAGFHPAKGDVVSFAVDGELRRFSIQSVEYIELNDTTLYHAVFRVYYKMIAVSG